MSDWRIRERYGYGAARITLNPDPPREARPPATLAAGLRAIAAELASEGWSGNLRSALSAAPALGFVATLLLALLLTISREHVDTTDLEIVQLEPELLPEPEVIPEPEPEPEPEVIPEPEPKIQIAEAPEPPPAVKPPPPPPRARPKLPEPPPPPKRVARPPPAPAPPPPARVAKRAPPKVQIDALPEPTPPPQAPAERIERPEPTPQRLALAPPLAIDPVPPKNPLLPASRAPAPPRAAPPARTPERREPPKLSLAPVAPLDLPETAPAALPSRAPQRRPDPAPQTARAAPPKLSFDLSAPAAANAAPVPETPTRATRVARAAPERSRARNAMPSSLTPVSALSASAPSKAQANPMSNRTERVAPNARLDGSRRDDNRLKAVALSSLAACRSDREEEELKLEVMGAIGARGECTSAAGRYRFVETKNLNAFLMWIERAPSRKQADRCVELRLTLECLRGTGG